MLGRAEVDEKGGLCVDEEVEDGVEDSEGELGQLMAAGAGWFVECSM